MGRKMATRSAPKWLRWVSTSDPAPWVEIQLKPSSVAAWLPVATGGCSP